MDRCVAGVAELTTAHVAQLDFLRAPLYILSSLLLWELGTLFPRDQILRTMGWEIWLIVREPHHLH